MNVSGIVWIRVATLVSVALVAGCSGASRQVNRLQLSYNSSTLRINIEDSKILVTRIEQEFANPVSPIPSATRAIRTQGELSQAQLDGLRKRIETSGFWKLKDAYGAPDGQRFYPYRIDLNLDGQSKQVLYRSNPSYESAPSAFTEVESLLRELSVFARNPVAP